MDDLQKNLKKMISAHPDCVISRQKLKSLLADYLPANKREMNLLLAAYDEGILEKLRNNADATLTAIRFVKQLQDDCGLMVDASFWTVESWCYMVGVDDTASAIKALAPRATQQFKQSKAESLPQSMLLKLGIYKAGLDFPPGEIRLKVVCLADDEQAQHQGVYYAILKKSSASNQIITNGFIKTQAILSINEGQRLEIGWQGDVELSSIEGV